MTLKTDDGSKFKVPWTEVLKFVGALCVPALGGFIWLRTEVSVLKNSQESFETAMATAIAATNNIIRSEAEHSREINRLQFASFGDRLDKHEEMIEELQRERRAVYQVAPK